MRRSPGMLRVVSVASAVVLSLAAASAIAVAAEDPIEKTADLIAEVAPQSVEVVDVGRVGDEVTVETDSADITIPGDPGSVIVLEPVDAGGEAVGVSLPVEVEVDDPVVASDGTVVYEATDGGSDVAVQVVEDGSVRVHTIIPDAGAPTEYTYQLDVPASATLELLDDGAVAIWDGGEWLGGVAAPWATDAAGRPVPTSYRLEGTAVVQTVDIPADATFPVVADPWLGNALYSKISVTVKSNGRWVVNAAPSAWGSFWNGMGTWDAHIAEVKNRVGSTRYNGTIYSQHVCHLMGWPLSLPEYNLESWRPNVSSAIQLVKNRCNP